MQNIFWLGFFIVIVIMLVIDLGVFNKKAHKVKIKEALVWTIIWITLALIFSVFIYFGLSQEKALEFLTGYVIEKALSIDNIFVFILIFSYFKIEGKYQHKILFWGILGAIIFRAIFIFAGIEIINRFHFVMYFFGAFLLFTGIKMLGGDTEEEVEFEEKGIIKFIKKLIPISKNKDTGKFFVKENGKTHATILFLTLVTVEISDLVFAIDSIPAILGISNDMFIVYTSNIFAILGLRSLYFVVSGMMGKFKYLKYGLSGILSFVGIKMLISGVYKIPIWASLSVILGLLILSILFSMLPKKGMK